jgi:TusA-related sulfurtransferase
MSASNTAAAFLDVSGLMPPEPMEQILEALAALGPGMVLQVLIDREPFPLYRVIERHGYRHRLALRDDGRFDLSIQKRPCSEH